MATASVPNSFTNGTAADADEVNQNFNALKDFANNSTVHVDGSKAFTSNVDAGSNKVVNVTAPTASTDAANKAYVDAVDTSLTTHEALTSGAHGISAFGATLVDDADASTARTTLGLGSLSTASTVNNDDWSGTDLAVTNGGTGASSASGARTNLGLGSLAVQNTINASDIDSDAVTFPKMKTTVYDGFLASSPTISTTEATGPSVSSVTASSGSLLIVTASMDVTWSDSPTTNCDTVYGTLQVDGVAQAGQIIMRPFEVASSGDVRWAGNRTWIIPLSSGITSATIRLRYGKLQNNNSVTLNGNATEADSHTRIDVLVFEAS